jgi:uncharacterized protein YjbJ (UPF0337 family)
MATKWEHIARQWSEFGVEAKKKWKDLTDDELVRINGNRNTLAMIIQQRYFVTKKAAHDQIEGWLEKVKV